MAQSLDWHYISTLHCILARSGQSFRLWGNSWHFKCQYNMLFEPLSYPVHYFPLPIMPSILGLVEKDSARKWVLAALIIQSTCCYSQSPMHAPPTLASCYLSIHGRKPLKDTLKLSRNYPNGKSIYLCSTRRVLKLGPLLNIQCGIMMAFASWGYQEYRVRLLAEETLNSITTITLTIISISSFNYPLIITLILGG